MDDIFKFGQGLLISKYNAPQFAAVDLSVLFKQPCAKLIQNVLITRRAFCNNTMRKRVCINCVCTKMLQHAAHNAFTRCYIASQTDCVFSGPVTHEDSVLW